MSRRREAAELARVLHLSTQEAGSVLDRSQYTISSPGNTDHSREMEIRPVGSELATGPMPMPMGGGVDPRMIMRPPASSGHAGGGIQSGASSSVHNSQSGASGNTGRSNEQDPSAHVTSNISSIQPFTPTNFVQPTNHILVPNSSDSQVPIPHQIPNPTASSIPSSAARGPQQSSTEKVASVHEDGPHFSPTQGSRRNIDPNESPVVPPNTDASPPRPNLKHQYSRVNAAAAITTPAPVAAATEEAGSSTRPFQLSSSPDMPKVAAPAPKPPRRSRQILEDSDEDVYDPSEKPKPAKVAKKVSTEKKKARKSTEKIVTSATKGAERDEGGPSERREERRESPDPLMIGPARQPPKTSSRQGSLSIVLDDTPLNGKKSKIGTKKPSTTKGKGKEKEKEKEKWADNEKEEHGVEAPKRLSSRVKDQQAKEAIEAARIEAETLERRRKRAEEKERLAREAGSGDGEIDNVQKEGEITEKVIETPEEGNRRSTPAVESVSSQQKSKAVDEEPKKVPSLTIRRRVLSSSPAPEENVVTVEKPGSAIAPRSSVIESYNQSVRPATVDLPVTEETAPAVAGPSKLPSPVKKAAPKKSATQTKKATAAAKKAAGKAKAAPKVVFKSAEHVADSEDEDEGVEKDKARPSDTCVKAIDTPKVVEKSKSPARRRTTTPPKSATPEPAPSPPKQAAPVRSPLTAVPARMANAASSSSMRHSPGPMSEKGTPVRPDGIKFKTASVLSKFPKSRFAGMSRRMNIAPLHAKIGPPKKELPPAPKKAEKRKKGDSDEDEDEDEDEEEEDEDGHVRKKKKKEKGMEWFMVED